MLIRSLSLQTALLRATGEGEPFFKRYPRSYKAKGKMLYGARSFGVNQEQQVKLILVVDDEVDIGMLIIQVIQEVMGHRAFYHMTGNHALEACRRQTPHLFILDYGLPDMTGIELHDQLHIFEHLRNVPTLLISIREPPQRELRKRNISFLPKPFDILRLQNTIADLLA